MRPLVVALVLWSLPVSAQRPLDQTSDFWREIRQPGTRQADAFLEQGLRHVERAAREQSDARRAALLRSAMLRFEAGMRTHPDGAELLFNLARVQTLYERPRPETGTVERMDEAAIATYERLRALHPLHRAEQVGFDLGILYSRVGRDDDAIDAYEDSIRTALSIEMTAVTHSNLAETRMMNGDLIGAVRDYERAIEVARRNSNVDGRALALPLWGLAVALDRLGEHRGALERAQEALSVGGGGMEVLRMDDVFFEPAAEIHFYEGLGFMALAEDALEPGARRTRRRQALASWRQYLRLAAEEDPWRSLAEEHAEQMSRE